MMLRNDDERPLPCWFFLFLRIGGVAGDALDRVRKIFQRGES